MDGWGIGDAGQRGCLLVPCEQRPGTLQFGSNAGPQFLVLFLLQLLQRRTCSGMSGTLERTIPRSRALHAAKTHTPLSTLCAVLFLIIFPFF